MSERRQHYRRRTLLDGRLEIARLNGWALDCSVRDLGAGGARVAIPGDIVVPQTVGLAISGASPRPVRLVWYREGQAGFALVDADARTLPPAVPPQAEPKDRFAARVAAIAARPAQGHFTRP